MQKFLKFIFGIKLYKFRAVPLSIISFSLQFRPDPARKPLVKPV